MLSTGTLLLGAAVPLNNQAEFEQDEQCADEREECPEYAVKDDNMYCENHIQFMTKNCAKSCGFCQPGPSSTIAPSTNALSGRPNAPSVVTTIASEHCADKIPNCAGQANKKYCEDNKVFMMEYCKKSCEFCENREETEPEKSALSWVTGNWRPCENGIQKRILQCYLKCGKRSYKVDISYCQIELEAEEPIAKRLCE